jgi:hypothetical protein
VAATRPIRKPTRPAAAPRTGDKSVATIASELWTLTVDYAKQEIKDPLTGLVAYVAWGIATMLLVGVGSILLAMGALRALQTQTGSTFTGNLSWVPYAIVLVGVLAVLGLVGALIMRGKR